MQDAANPDAPIRLPRPMYELADFGDPWDYWSVHASSDRTKVGDRSGCLMAMRHPLMACCLELLQKGPPPGKRG